MPLTTSGKINRNALPDVDLSAVDGGVEYVAPVGETEINLAALMERILGYSPIGRNDDFFALGGDSLAAIELLSALESSGNHTDIKTLFANPTVGQLAAKLTPFEQNNVSVDIEVDIPATPAQLRVYTAHAMQGGTVYNVPFAFRAADVDYNRLQTAVQALVNRYEILRTRFIEKNGKIIQVVEPHLSVKIETLNQPDISAFVRPFDLSKLPLIRVGCYGNIIMVDVHHIITDGGSLTVFFHELNEFYMGRELSATPVQYRQFAITPQDYSISEKYWLSVYADNPPTVEINTDFKRKKDNKHNGKAVYSSLDYSLHKKIINSSRKQNITPYAFYLGGFYILLSKLSGCEDIVVGVPMSGREGQFVHTLGMFVNTVALRNKPIGTKTVREFLGEVKENNIAAIVNQNYPFNELVKKLNLEKTPRNPLFDVMFAYQDGKIVNIVFGDEQAEVMPVAVTTAKYDFTVNVVPDENNVILMTECNTDLYCQNTIERFINAYQFILEQMLNEDVLLKDISAVDADERQKLLYDFNDTAAEYPCNKCVHTLFEEQAAKTPDKTAVIACDKTLTYKELNEQANRIAHGLTEKGVTVGDIVAFALPRTSNLIAVMLGILKAGAAYLPIVERNCLLRKIIYRNLLPTATRKTRL